MRAKATGLGGRLRAILDPEDVRTRYLDRVAQANDASVYRLVPRAVVRPRSTAEIRSLFRLARSERIPLAFRAAGTSLSGQAVTDGILVDVSRHWRSVEILDDGMRVRTQPGVIGGRINLLLRPFRRKIGPDPASINSCMLGGILANNSSGMCCGVADNAYHTLESIRFVLPSGLELDTADPSSADRLEREEPALARGLAALRNRVLADGELAGRIRAKYRMKNTTGYALNAFVDFERPIDVLAHLLIGSEGTLAFIAEAILRTIPDPPWKQTGLLYFPDVRRACEAIAPLRESGARTLELMDRPSLRAFERQPEAPEELRDLPAAAAAILFEYQCDTDDERAARAADCDRLLPSLPLAAKPTVTADPARQAGLWRLRKGLIPAVGAVRRRGTSFILEDVVFPLDRLATGVTGLQALFREHAYDDAIVFGHARDGNLHFVLTQAFDDPRDVERYDRFMRDLAGLVAVRHGGALKAEHGTGRNMAPFVATEWGEKAWRVMRDLKRLVDPDCVLNPGVLINEDPRAHVTHLKDLPAVEAEVDRCIECGFCERLCPSRDLTLTPRQRIVVRREVARLRATDPDSPLLRELERDWRWDGDATCATDGLCATGCPVAIDTGRLIKRLRGEARGTASHEIARLAAGRLRLVERVARAAVRVARLTPSRAPDLPRPAPKLPPTTRDGAAAVVFATCVSRILGPAEAGRRPAVASLVDVSARAGSAAWIPEGIHAHCCGLAFGSKGWSRASRHAAARAVRALWEWTGGGRLPVIVDQSPCARALRNAADDLPPSERDLHARLEILDGVDWAHDRLLPRLTPRRRKGTVAVHPVCSIRETPAAAKLEAIARAVADDVHVPASAGCCGFAGDRGFTVPELTRAATKDEAEEIRARCYAGHCSSSRTCEIALARATGRTWDSFWTLLDEGTRAPESPGSAASG